MMYIPFCTSAFKREGACPPLLSPIGSETAKALTTSWTHRWKQLVRMAEPSYILPASDLTMLDCMWENHWTLGIVQLRLRKWRMEFTTQHLLTVKYLRQQLSLWTVCRPAIRMFLSNYRKIYATTSVSFQYLRSTVDKYVGKSVLDTSTYLKNMCWKVIEAL